MIIIQLPPRIIISTVARVNRDWKALIETSLSIRKRTYMTPSSPEVVTPSFIHLRIDDGTFIYKEFIRVNSLLPQAPANSCPQETAVWSSQVMPAPGFGSSTKNKQLCRLWRREATQSFESTVNGSWRHMFISDPPCTLVSGRITSNDRKLSKVGFSIQDRRGVKLGVIEDVVQSALASGRKYGSQSNIIGGGAKLFIYVDYFAQEEGSSDAT